MTLLIYTDIFVVWNPAERNCNNCGVSLDPRIVCV